MHAVREKDFSQTAVPKRNQEAKALGASVCHSCKELVALWKKAGCQNRASGCLLLTAPDLASVDIKASTQ